MLLILFLFGRLLIIIIIIITIIIIIRKKMRIIVTILMYRTYNISILKVQYMLLFLFFNNYKNDFLL